jgi:hypothetical protein
MVLIRDHGPPIANVRLTLHTLRAYMDETGYTFVGQSTIAAAACLSKPTVRKMLTVAWRQKWIGISIQGRHGKQWRHYEYRACIPDGLEVPEKHIELVETWCAQHGEVDTDYHPDIHKLGKPLTHVEPSKAQPRPEGGKTDAPKVGKPTCEGGKNEAAKVGNGLSPKSSSAEVLINPKCSSAEGAVCDSTSCVEISDSRIETEAKAEAQRKAASDRAERIRKAIRQLPEFGDADIAKIARVDLHEVQHMRTAT